MSPSTAWREYSSRELLCDRPVISVLVPTWNHGHYLTDAVDAIVAQVVDVPVEVLIGVDFCTDNTLEIALTLQRSFPNCIRVFSTQERLGPHENFKQLYESSRGAFLAYCDGDDIWTDPSKLLRQLAYLRANPSVVLVYHDVSVIDSGGRCIAESKIRDYWKEDRHSCYSPAELASGVSIPTLSVMFRAVPIAFDGIMRVANQDTYLFAMLGEYGRAQMIDGVLGSYRAHHGGSWSTKDMDAHFADKAHTFEVLTQEIRGDLRPYATLSAGEISLGYSIFLLRKGRIADACLYFWKYVRGVPIVLCGSLDPQAKWGVFRNYLSVPRRVFGRVFRRC